MPTASALLNSIPFAGDSGDQNPTLPCSLSISGDSNPLSSHNLPSRRRDSLLVDQESPSALTKGISSSAQDSQGSASGISVERSPIAPPPVCKISVASQCDLVSVGDDPSTNFPSELPVTPQSIGSPTCHALMVPQPESDNAAGPITSQHDFAANSQRNHPIIPERELSVTCSQEPAVALLHNPSGGPRSEPSTPSQGELSVPPERKPSVPRRTPSAPPCRELSTQLQHKSSAHSTRDSLIASQDEPPPASNNTFSAVSEGEPHTGRRSSSLLTSYFPPLLSVQNIV